jgi:hypothetical protein
MRKFYSALVLLTVFLLFSACVETEVEVKPVDNDTAKSDESNVTPDETVVDEEQNNDDEVTVPDDDEDPEESGCATSNLGKSCVTDTECGACMICATGGKCVKGCTTNEDCTMSVGLKCNKKLARCTNVFASLQACGETKCPTGCCYGDKGLTGVKCLTTAEASKCGLCPQGEIYIPDDSKCVPAVCSTTTDNCPTLNTGSTSPKPACFACKSGEFICQANTTTSGCSAGVIINAAKCIPAGQQCVAGVSECCSGMPCIQGYCY